MTSLKTILTIAAFIASAYAQTTISGDLGNMTLDSAGNPFIVEKDITVPRGKSLTIKEGCALIFKQFTGLTILGGCTVDGTKEHPVVFTSINDAIYNKTTAQEAGAFDWNGITVQKKSGPVVLNCIDVRYSVYGIKSQNPGIVIRQSTFNQNGQFHFTVNEKIQPVQENQPYSYNDSPQAQTADATPAKTEKPGNIKIIRYGLLGVGSAAAIAGAVMSIKAAGAYSDWKDIENKLPADIQPGEYEKLQDDYNGAFTWALILDILGGLGLAGFGVTFAF
ncbi:MAG: hypothetical protein JW768_16745 [Chitinispirillaceae bacterium]|nr:hypothetical protein [Chitinispirillaceae bacterium]